jgi:hypothetical protein
MKVVRLSPLQTGRLCPQEITSYKIHNKIIFNFKSQNFVIFTLPQDTHPWSDHFYLLTVGVGSFCFGWLRSDKPQTVGILWTKDRLEADNTQHSQESDVYAPRGNGTHNHRNRGAADSRLRLCSHRDWRSDITVDKLRRLRCVVYVTHTYEKLVSMR